MRPPLEGEPHHGGILPTMRSRVKQYWNNRPFHTASIAHREPDRDVRPSCPSVVHTPSRGVATPGGPAGIDRYDPTHACDIGGPLVRARAGLGGPGGCSVARGRWGTAAVA